MTFSTRCMRAEDWSKVAPEFTPQEFNHPEKMGYEFMLWLHQVRLKLGMSLRPSSDYRDDGANENAGGASKSAHMDTPCDAIDFSAKDMTAVKRFKLVEVAMKLGCQRIGIYENGSVHLDRTEDKRPSPVIWVKV